ncbi:DUF2461 domain-containing protein [Pseudooceanicola sp.]|uniref:DUF2461 domain-containing protein n=1 Tax=Pseudooceanicola sp. TaxID=1914328 RepID=UPI002609ABE2|nr:DUF2461 domain-containing protein [Pseudooceanicola sp.]MDF1855551.1 DUF2461 domain-containing protein [Pseudooceanicola sp.]
MTEFSDFIPQARDFLIRLRADNSRDWFAAHQDEYDATIKAPAKRLLDEIAAPLAGITGAKVSKKLFRPQRDIRFSKDKTPYKDHCHMLWHAPAGSEVGYYFGIAPDYVRIGAGIMGFNGSALDQWRGLVDSATGAELAQLLDNLRAAGCDISKPDLKRVPAPYDKDHPRGDLLRRKSLTVWSDVAPDISDLPEALIQRFTRFALLGRLLSQAISG